jgi:hypothetical protein
VGRGEGARLRVTRWGFVWTALREAGGEVEVLQRSNGGHLAVAVWCHVVAARRNWWAALGEGKAFLGMVWAMLGWMKMKK